MIRPSVLWFALLISAPAVYRYVIDEVDITVVLLRFLIAVPIAAVLLAASRSSSRWRCTRRSRGWRRTSAGSSAGWPR
jgi:hypothetical protein